MSRHKLLIQWIGHSDLRAMSKSLPPKKLTKELEAMAKGPIIGGKDGPTKTLLDQQDFDEIYLLSNYNEKWNKLFSTWIKKKVNITSVDLSNPTDHQAILETAEKQLSQVMKSQQDKDVELCIHLSPGTPAMHAVWLLLGKTRYPATFYETHQGNWSISTVPFVLMDIIPDVLRDPDTHLQHLASEAPTQVEGFEDIIGNSRAIRDAVGRAKRIAIRSISTLLLGESGTGKEMFSLAIHKASTRRSKPFKAVNCAALSKTLLESELFGHKKNSFTGANADRAGAFESADGGTIFLDEVGECDLETQAKLLRVLQPITKEGASIRKFSRLGEDKDRKVDVRVIAATNRDLLKAITEGKFREDLYYRLAGATISLPPLRERRSDLRILSDQLLNIANKQFAADEPGYKHKKFSPSAIEFIKGENWPGNVRQLNNTIVQAAIFSDGNTINRRDLQAAMGDTLLPRNDMLENANITLGDGFDLKKHLESIEEKYVRQAMDDAHANRAEAARLLGLSGYQTLDGKLERLGISKKFGKSKK